MSLHRRAAAAMVEAHIEEVQVPEKYDQEVVLEVRREGRRPRYHRGARQAGTGVRLDPPQCNLDDVRLEVRVLDYLPDALKRPWSQLCRRCWAGSTVLEAADKLRAVS